MERNSHIAFSVESAHGHVNPVLGIMAELVRRGCRVSCAVSEYFAPRVAATGAQPLLYKPFDHRVHLAPRAQKCQKDDVAALAALWREFEREEIDVALKQFKVMYADDRPDLIVYDFRNLAGRALANAWGIKTIEHAPMLIESNERNQFGVSYDDRMVLVSIPRFLQRNADTLDERFKFIGPSFSYGNVLRPWKFKSQYQSTLLVCATTSAPQLEFFRLAIQAFESLECGVILSIGDEIDAQLLGPLPSHFEINRFSSHMDILAGVSLLVFQGGPRGALEALYHGVPMLIVPESGMHTEVATRVAELGLGRILDEATTSARQLRDATVALLEDDLTQSRVKEIQKMLRATNATKNAADLIISTLREVS